jgi:hypothetical protein
MSIVSPDIIQIYQIYYEEITSQLHLTNKSMGGLFSMDGIHPTRTGYAAIAKCLMRIMRNGAGTNGSFGGHYYYELGEAIQNLDLSRINASDPLRARQ